MATPTRVLNMYIRLKFELNFATLHTQKILKQNLVLNVLESF